MTKTVERRWLLAILLAGLAVRLAAVVVLQIEPESDYLEYRTMALNLVEGKGLIDSTRNRGLYSVGYPLLIVAPVFAVFGNHLLAVQLVNACLGAVSILCCYGVARAAGAGPIGRLLAPAFLAMYLPSILYAEYLAKENLMTPVVLGVVWCALRLAQRPCARVALLSGCLFGLLALAGNSGLATVPVTLLGLQMSSATLRAKVGLSVLAAAIALAVAAPWMIRNLYVLGEPVLNSNGGFNLYLGNNERATGFYMSIADTPRGPTWQSLRDEGELQASNTLRAEALDWMTHHPWQVLRLSVRKVGLFWMPPIHQGEGPGSAAETLTRRLWLVQFVLLVVAAVLGVVWSNGHWRCVTLIVLAIGAFTAVHVLFYVSFRYREPVMPLLCVLSGFAVERLVTLRLLQRQDDIPGKP